jgi:hypothetical protein
VGAAGGRWGGLSLRHTRLDYFPRVRPWTIEYADLDFERFYLSLAPYEQAVVDAALTTVLAVHGIAAFDGGWGKALGAGLYEFRIQRSLDAIMSMAGTTSPLVGDTGRRLSIRIFCTFHGNKIIVLFQGYDKGRDPSTRRQQQEIARARRALQQWRIAHRNDTKS